MSCCKEDTIRHSLSTGRDTSILGEAPVFNIMKAEEVHDDANLEGSELKCTRFYYSFVCPVVVASSKYIILQPPKSD